MTRAIPLGLRESIESDIVGVDGDLVLSGGRFDEQQVAVERIATGSTHRGYRVVGRSEWFLKVYRKPVSGLGRECEILQALAGCRWVPEFGAALLAVKGERRTGFGMIQRWVQGRNLWDGFVSGAEISVGEFDWRGLGTSLRGVHAALGSLAAVGKASKTTLDSCELARSIRESASASAVGVGERAILLRWAETAEALNCGVVPMEECGVIHGDLHLGQVLRSDEGAIQFIDFEGEPHMRDGCDRLIVESRLRDVAGVARSIGYLWDAVRGDWTAEAVVRAFLYGYFGGAMVKDAEERFRYFCVQRAYREWCYEMAYRPDWVQRPLRVPIF